MQFGDILKRKNNGKYVLYLADDDEDAVVTDGHQVFEVFWGEFEVFDSSNRELVNNIYEKLYKLNNRN